MNDPEDFDYLPWLIAIATLLLLAFVPYLRP